ncbi:MAG: SDR family oxidoreductase [Chlorobiales bacterium]|nr:SDR family oxidoreductase [Chlorobiales bacterium]
MKVLLLGASGATGKLVGLQLLKKGIHLRLVVRENAVLPQELLNLSVVEIIRGNITDFSPSEFSGLIADCDAVVSCLGHNITLKGMFGQPHFLVSDTVRNVCKAITDRANKKIRIILMSTTAFTNRGIGEKNSLGERVIFSILYALLPPHTDNMKAADYLINEIGTRNDRIEWVAVRPDSLFDEEKESKYSVVGSPTRSPIFNAGRTSRINVSHFMSELLTTDALWQEWTFKTPVIYNDVPS